MALYLSINSASSTGAILLCPLSFTWVTRCEFAAGLPCVLDGDRSWLVSTKEKEPGFELSAPFVGDTNSVFGVEILVFIFGNINLGEVESFWSASRLIRAAGETRPLGDTMLRREVGAAGETRPLGDTMLRREVGAAGETRPLGDTMLRREGDGALKNLNKNYEKNLFNMINLI